MPQLFPPEIISNTTESLFVRRNSKTWLVYLAVLLAVSGAAAALPFVHVQISTQALDVVRAPEENNQLQTAVYGEVMENYLCSFSFNFSATSNFIVSKTALISVVFLSVG
jgi:HlyD family secretion protein